LDTDVDSEDKFIEKNPTYFVYDDGKGKWFSSTVGSCTTGELFYSSTTKDVLVKNKEYTRPVGVLMCVF
jgi:hypothetical protein